VAKFLARSGIPEMSVRRNIGALELQELVKSYGDEVAVDRVSLSVEAGEFVTVLGPSGSGKTTTLSMIAGFTRPDAGLITLDGTDITYAPAHKRNIGMVFQNYSLFPHMTTAQNVAFPLEMRKIAREDARGRVEAAFERVHLSGLGHRYPRELSGGQQQRVALARAFVFGPRLLLMDEPLGALDRKLRERLQLEIMRLSRELGITVFYVTHDQEEALVMSDRIVIYNKGVIEQVGTAQTLYERPASRFVADFIGESNIFQGTLDKSSGVVSNAKYRVRIDPDAARSHERGALVAVVVRPEHIDVEQRRPSDGASDGPAVVLVGVLQEAIYLGPTVRCIVELDVGQTVTARIRPDVWQMRGLRSGDQVAVSWRCEHGVLVTDSQSDPTLEAPTEEALVGASSVFFEAELTRRAK
jgi:putative spermidine/putrescine transport system ATP-binding protein